MLRPNCRRIPLRLRLYDRYRRAKDPDYSGIHREQTSTRGNSDARHALAVKQPMWMVGGSAYDTLAWHDHLLATGVVPVDLYNPRNTDEPKDIEYRIEDRIEEHSENVQLKQSTLKRRTTAVLESNELTNQ